MRPFAIVIAALLAVALPMASAIAQDQTPAPTEKLGLKPHRIKGSLIGYGYDVGEFNGELRTVAKTTRAVIYKADSSRTVFTVAPGPGKPATATCGGGQSNWQVGWFEFKVQELSYVCKFEGGPPDAAFALALSEAGPMASLYQPQRAAQLTWNGRTVRAITRKVQGAMIMSGGRVQSYKILNSDGREIGSLVRGVLQPTFNLPPVGSPDREAAAVMALALFFFADPANPEA